jgi:hypothetical protein
MEYASDMKADSIPVECTGTDMLSDGDGDDSSVRTTASD